MTVAELDRSIAFYRDVGAHHLLERLAAPAA